MREGLGVVAEGGARVRVDLLRVEPDVVSEGEQPLERLARLVELPGAGEGFDRPEAADAVITSVRRAVPPPVVKVVSRTLVPGR